LSFASAYKKQLMDAIGQIELEKVEQATRWLRQARDANKQIFTCGNGGSASTASHFVCDILRGASNQLRGATYQREKRFRILALTESISTLTAYANDVDYNSIFVEQLRNFANSGDVLIAISGSGNSRNVLAAAEYAKALGCRVIGLTGRDGGELAKTAQLDIRVPVRHMGQIEDVHLIICHMIAYELMGLSETNRSQCMDAVTSEAVSEE
jgi:D-sedoheptulose 7-phosphate isomerase